MKRIAMLLMVLIAVACASSGEEGSAVPLRGKLLVEIAPNPIVAKSVRGDTYDFPFEVSLREIGGVAVEIETIRADVKLAGLNIFSQLYDKQEMLRRGFESAIPAGGNLQYRFNPRRTVMNEALFQSVTAEVTVTAVDAAGRTTESHTAVSVRR